MMFGISGSAAAAILGSFAAAMPLGRRASPPARITALQTTGAVAAGSVSAAAAAILLGTTANLGLAIVAASFGLCTGTGAMLAARARQPRTVSVAIVAVALISIAVVVIVARIAMPGLSRARITANESSTISSLRSILSAQAAFSASCGNSFFSPSLARLGVPPLTSREAGNGFIAADLAADPVTRSGYTIVITPGPAVATAPASCNAPQQARSSGRSS